MQQILLSNKHRHLTASELVQMQEALENEGVGALTISFQLQLVKVNLCMECKEKYRLAQGLRKIFSHALSPATLTVIK